MKERILVVDDDVAITHALRRALSFEGYIVSIAHDGEAAGSRSRFSALPQALRVSLLKFLNSL